MWSPFQYIIYSVHAIMYRFFRKKLGARVDSDETVTDLHSTTDCGRCGLPPARNLATCVVEGKQSSSCPMLARDGGAPPEDVTELDDESDVQVNRDVLSRHTCTASFKGLEPGMEPMLRVFPPRPAKTWATFDIDSYVEYEQVGQYGDEQQSRFAFEPAECQDAAVMAALGELKPGDRVLIKWQHEYVTRSSFSARMQQRTSASFPERPVVMLERVA